MNGSGPAIDRRSALKAAAGGLALVSSFENAVKATKALSPGRQSAEARALAIVSRMTFDEQLQLVSGRVGFANVIIHAPKPDGAIGSAGFVRGIPRLRVPSLQESDGGQGVSNSLDMRPGDEATLLPSGLALAATFDPELVRRAGSVAGAEARAKGFNVLLGGIAQLVREPRGGRNFESGGEDPLLCGRIVGAMISGTQSQKIISTIKHFAVNCQETGRSVQNAVIDEDALHESDLLAFRIAIDEGQPGSVLTAYNKINGNWSSESPLLNNVVKGEWGFDGWIMTDWGGAHSAIGAALAGLDQESGREFDDKPWFTAPLKKAIVEGAVTRGRLADMNVRIIRTLIKHGVFDDPPRPGGSIAWDTHAVIAQQAAEAGIVLLKNEGRVLPLPAAGSILLVGGHADKGVPTGGGSAQVYPRGGIAYRDKRGDGLMAMVTQLVYAPSRPLAALRAEIPRASIEFDEGDVPVRAAAKAAKADIAIVFAVKRSGESVDNADLHLPDEQDDLIAAVAAANPRTIVVLETGNAVVMPWLPLVKAVVQAWYPGQKGAEALAAILSGRISPSGRLPISYPKSIHDLPRPVLPGWRPDVGVDLAIGKRPEPFDIHYDEGSDVGYRWYERSGREPLFAFGHGLTYSKFEYSNLEVAINRGRLEVSFTLRNVGRRTATEVPQVYVAPPGRTHRLVGWRRIALDPGEGRRITVSADRRILVSRRQGKWVSAKGDYRIYVGPAAGDKALSFSLSDADGRLAANLAEYQRGSQITAIEPELR